MPSTTPWQIFLTFFRKRGRERFALLTITADEHDIRSLSTSTYVAELERARTLGSRSVKVFIPRKVIDVAVLASNQETGGDCRRSCQLRTVLMNVS